MPTYEVDELRAQGLLPPAFAQDRPRMPSEADEDDSPSRGKRTRQATTSRTGGAKGGKFAALAAYCANRKYPLPDDEFRFHPVRRWRWDAAWPERMLAVEFHGGAFTQGRHTRGSGFTADQEKFATAAILGWRIIPVTSEQFEAGALWELIDAEFQRGTEVASA